MDEATRRGLTERLVRRLEGLASLHAGEVLTGAGLGRQLFQLVSSREAWLLACSVTDEEREARRLLVRLGDPERWRSDSSESEERRRAILEERLCEALLSSGKPDGETLEMLLDTACLPHFIGFVRDRAGAREPARTSGGRVKVLD